MAEAVGCELAESSKWAIQDPNTLQNPREKPTIPEKALQNPVQSPHVGAELEPAGRDAGTTQDPGLQAVVAAWPRLPEAMRTGILAMVGAVGRMEAAEIAFPSVMH